MSQQVGDLCVTLGVAIATTTRDKYWKNTVLSINHLPRRHACPNSNKSSFDCYGRHVYEDPVLYLDEICTWLTVEHNTILVSSSASTVFIGQGIFNTNTQLHDLCRLDGGMLGSDCGASDSGILHLCSEELHEGEY